MPAGPATVEALALPPLGGLTPPAAAAVPPDIAAERDSAPPTQRRLGPRAGDEEVAAPPAAGSPTAATRTRGDRGLFRTELLPLLLLGGAVAAAYVACLQLAMRRREARAGSTTPD